MELKAWVKDWDGLNRDCDVGLDCDLFIILRMMGFLLQMMMMQKGCLCLGFGYCCLVHVLLFGGICTTISHQNYLSLPTINHHHQMMWF